MPRPPILAYAEPELISSAIDNTSVHSDIDKLLLENKMLRGNEEFYNNSLETDYGKPYKYKTDKYEGDSVPLNMRHYADIMERANISKAFEEANIKSPFSAAQHFKSLGVKVEDLQDSLLSRMKRGDAPMGMVAYYEPHKLAAEDDVKWEDSMTHPYLPSGARTAALFTEAKNTSTSPDTLKLFDNWDIYTNTLHEPLHGIRVPLQGKTVHLGHTEEGVPPFDQESFNSYEEELMKNLVLQKHGLQGYSVTEQELSNLFDRNMEDEPPKGETYVTDMFDRLLKGAPVKKQQGGPISYLQPAVQDETAHDSMDRLMFENELEQQPQHSMRTYQQGYDPAMEWGEGMMPIGGIIRGSKGVLGLVKGQGPKIDYFRKQAEKSLLKEYDTLEKQFRGRDIRKTLSSSAGKKQVKDSVLLDYILKSLKGKIKGQGLIE